MSALLSARSVFRPSFSLVLFLCVAFSSVAQNTATLSITGEVTTYLLISAADGYEVLYSLAEIDPDFTDQVILLATSKDGKPLAGGERIDVNYLIVDCSGIAVCIYKGKRPDRIPDQRRYYQP